MTHIIFASFSVLLLIVLTIILVPIFRAREISMRQRYEIAGTVFVFFFAAAFAIYYYVGAPQVVALNNLQQQHMAHVQRTISAQRNLLIREPENAQAWVALGGAYMQTGQYMGARNAYQKAVKLTEGHPSTIVAYASALVAQSNGKVTAEAKKSLDIVMLQEPENPDAHYFLALHKMQNGQMKEAMAEMRALYYRLPNDSPLREHINRQMGRAPLEDDAN